MEFPIECHEAFLRQLFSKKVRSPFDVFSSDRLEVDWSNLGI